MRFGSLVPAGLVAVLPGLVGAGCAPASPDASPTSAAVPAVAPTGSLDWDRPTPQPDTIATSGSLLLAAAAGLTLRRRRA